MTFPHSSRVHSNGRKIYSMFDTKHTVLVALLAVIWLVGCGNDGGPTSSSEVPAQSSLEAGEATILPAGSWFQTQTTENTTVADILADPSTYMGQRVQLTGLVTQQLSPASFLFDDGTGVIPADFPDGPLPTVGDTVSIDGTVIPGTGDFVARISVQIWGEPTSFSCDDIIEVRARFSDPGFVAGDVVGYYLAYYGVPAGNKTLEITWDEHNPSGQVDLFELGQGDPRGDGLFDLEGVAGHEYPNVTGTETKKVRANLMIDGRTGHCSRVRDVTVTKGSGPGYAAGGKLSLQFGDPVQSGGFFSVTARVTNPSSVTIDALLFFEAPDDSTIRTLGAGCIKLNSKEAECLIEGIEGDGFGEEFVQYDVPVVSKSTEISGSVTLVARDFSSVAKYSTTVEP